MRIIGIDPGTRFTGVGIIDTQGNKYRLVHFEVVKLKASDPIARRLQAIHEQLNLIIKEYHPEVLAIEDVFYGKDLKAMVRIGEARACAMLAASEQGLDVVEYAPARVKQAVTGNGRASKEQIQQMVKTLLNLKTAPPSDGADALAVAICHVHSAKKIIGV